MLVLGGAGSSSGPRCDKKECTSFAKASPGCTEGQVLVDAGTSGRCRESMVITKRSRPACSGTSYAIMKKLAWGTGKKIRRCSCRSRGDADRNEVYLPGVFFGF